MNEQFIERLKQAFGHATMAEIARRISVPHATVRNYFTGRMPAPNVLMKIAAETNVSLNWLLIGTGEIFIEPAESADLNRLIDRRIEAVIDRKLAALNGAEVQNLGAIDEPPAFDVEEAVLRLDDPHLLMVEWFRHEGRKSPADFGVVFFQGWASYSHEEKVEAVRDAKRVLDRTLKIR